MYLRGKFSNQDCVSRELEFLGTSDVNTGRTRINYMEIFLSRNETITIEIFHLLKLIISMNLLK